MIRYKAFELKFKKHFKEKKQFKQVYVAWSCAISLSSGKNIQESNYPQNNIIFSICKKLYQGKSVYFRCNTKCIMYNYIVKKQWESLLQVKENLSGTVSLLEVKENV